MSNRIVFRVYEENRFTGLKSLTYSITLKTNLTAAEVVDFLEVYDGFSAYVVEGIALSFVDFSCLVISSDAIVSKLKCVPTVDEEPRIVLPGKCIIKIENENNEEVLTRNKNELVYTYSRYECGASGFGETIIQWVSTHPVEMIFIGGWIWDRAKDIWAFFRNSIFRATASEDKDTPIIFSPRKFHKNLSNLMNLDPFYFQIIDISPITQGKHIITVRTIKNEKYQVIAKANGDIISLEKQVDIEDK